MDAIFDSQAPVITSAVAAANRIQGIGGGDPGVDTSSRSQSGAYVSSGNSRSVQQDAAQSYTGHSGASGPLDINQFPNSRNYENQTGTYNQPGSGRMQGFGNPNFADRGQPTNTGLASTASSLAQSAASMLVAAAGELAGRVNSGTFSNDSGGAGNYTTQYVPQTANAAYNTTQTQNVWGSAVQKTPPTGAVLPDIPVQPSGLGRAGGAADDGSYESQMLETLCEAGGLKTALNEEQLKSFLNVAPTLNAQIVGASLSALLNHDAWQTRTKALMLIASLVQHKDCDAHFEFWQTNSEEISGLLGDPKAAVRAQAIKALQAAMVELDAETIRRAGGTVNANTGMGGGVNTQEKSGKSSSAANKAAAQLSLLDLTDDSPPTIAPLPAPVPMPMPVSVPVPVAVYTAAPATSLDFFDGLSAPTTPASPIATLSSVSSQQQLQQLQQQPPQQLPVAPSSTFDLLDGFSGSPTAAPAPPSPAAYDPFASAPAVSLVMAPQVMASPPPPQIPSTSTYDLSFLSNTAPVPAPVPVASQNRVDLNSLLNVHPAPTPMPYGMPPSVASRPVGSFPAAGNPQVSSQLFYLVLTSLSLFLFLTSFDYYDSCLLFIAIRPLLPDESLGDGVPVRIESVHPRPFK